MASISKHPSFYFVDKDYHEYLKKIDKHITNIEYANRIKFVYGLVFETEEKICYFVPVSSYAKAKENNILIKITNNKIIETAGSLRFNYMFPVPLNCLTPVNFKDTSYFNNEERIKVEKEYLYIKKKIGIKTILKKAKETYNAVITKSDKELLNNSCDFKLLEKAYWEYIHRSDDDSNKISNS